MAFRTHRNSKWFSLSPRRLHVPIGFFVNQRRQQVPTEITKDPISFRIHFNFNGRATSHLPKKKKLRKLRLIYTFMCENVSSLSNLCTQRHLNAFSFFFQANRFGWSQYLCSLSLFGAAVSLWVREMRCNGCKSQGLMVLETGGHHTTIQFMWAWAIVSKIDKLWS